MPQFQFVRRFVEGGTKFSEYLLELRNSCSRPILMRMPDQLAPLRHWYWSSLVVMPGALVVIPEFFKDAIIDHAVCIEDAHVFQLYADGVPVRTPWSLQ